jgi:hypothetical protein
MGKALYPDPQWDALERLWEAFYPVAGLEPAPRRLLEQLEASMPALVTLLVNHRPPALRGRSLGEVLGLAAHRPAVLRAHYREWLPAPSRFRAARPSLAFAVIGQARADGAITPETESRLLGTLLTHWARQSTLDRTAICATPNGRSGAERQVLAAAGTR